MIKMHEDFFKQIFTSHFICKGSKRVTQGLHVRGSWRLNINCNILTPLLWPSALCLSRSPGLLNRRPRAHTAGCQLSLLHLISIFSGPQFIRAPSPFGLVWLSLPHLSPTLLQLNSTGTGTWLPPWLHYIIIQCPHDRPLNLWNRMFNHHQAEITVMQFRGHSLPVHQSMSVPWEFFSSYHFISQFPPTRFPLPTAIGMCHFLPVHHLEWHFGPGWRSKHYSVLDMTLNCIWWWGSSPWILGNVEYPFIAITPVESQ